MSDLRFFYRSVRTIILLHYILLTSGSQRYQTGLFKQFLYPKNIHYFENVIIDQVFFPNLRPTFFLGTLGGKFFRIRL